MKRNDPKWKARIEGMFSWSTNAANQFYRKVERTKQSKKRKQQNHLKSLEKK